MIAAILTLGLLQGGEERPLKRVHVALSDEKAPMVQALRALWKDRMTAGPLPDPPADARDVVLVSFS